MFCDWVRCWSSVLQIYGVVSFTSLLMARSVVYTEIIMLKAWARLTCSIVEIKHPLYERLKVSSCWREVSG